MSIVWATVGYSLAFGDGNGFIGDFDHAFLNDIGFEPREELAADHTGRAGDQNPLFHQSGSQRRHHGTSLLRGPPLR
jgi:hypothetical protein